MLFKNVNFFTGRPPWFKQRWEGLADEFDLSREEMSKLLSAFPSLLEISYERKIRPLQKMFASWGIPFSGFRSAVMRHPKVLRQPLKTKVWAVQDVFHQAGFLPEEFGNIVMQRPEILCIAPKDLWPHIREIQSIGLPKKDFVEVLQKHPNLLKLSMDKRMEWFESVLGNEGPIVMRSLLVTNPEIFAGSTSILSSKVDVLKSFGINRPGRQSIIQGQPIVLCESSDDLRDKLQILQETMQKSPQDIVSCPAFLTFPLRDLLTRVKFLEIEGVHLSSLVPDQVLGDDVLFASTNKISIEEFRTFAQKNVQTFNPYRVMSRGSSSRYSVLGT